MGTNAVHRYETTILVFSSRNEVGKAASLAALSRASGAVHRIDVDGLAGGTSC